MNNIEQLLILLNKISQSKNSYNINDAVEINNIISNIYRNRDKDSVKNLLTVNTDDDDETLLIYIINLSVLCCGENLYINSKNRPRNPKGKPRFMEASIDCCESSNVISSADCALKIYNDISSNNTTNDTLNQFNKNC